MKKHVVVVTLAAMSALTIAGSVVSAQAAQGAESSSRGDAIRGVWRTVVTPRNCQTDEPIVSFPGLFTFNDGGTLSEFGIPPGSNPALRSPGHGLWQREHGWQEYSLAFTYYRYNASGVFLGSQRVTGALELALGGDEFATRSAIEVLDVSGNVIGTACATAAGTRF